MGYGSDEQQQRNAAVVAALRALSLKRLVRERARRSLMAGALLLAGALVPVVGVTYGMHAQQRAKNAALYAKWARVDARCGVLAKRREEIQQDMVAYLEVATSEQARAEIRTEAAWRAHHLAGLRAEAGCSMVQPSVSAAPRSSIQERQLRRHGNYRQIPTL